MIFQPLGVQWWLYKSTHCFNGGKGIPGYRNLSFYSFCLIEWTWYSFFLGGLYHILEKKGRGKYLHWDLKKSVYICIILSVPGFCVGAELTGLWFWDLFHWGNGIPRTRPTRNFSHHSGSMNHTFEVVDLGRARGCETASWSNPSLSIWSIYLPSCVYSIL